MPHRFFIPPNNIIPPIVQFSGDTVRQIKTVLRMQPGDEIVVLDNSGAEYRVALVSVEKRQVTGRIIAKQTAIREPAVGVTLYQGMLKANKFEWILQKCTELGVCRFTPTICQRSIVRDPKSIAKKNERWQAIIREAAEQSGRGRLPQLEPAISLAEAVSQAQAEGVVIMAWEEAADQSLRQTLSEAQTERMALFIGPEGGFAPEEAALARESGAKLVTLGPRILRAETAAIAAVASIFYELNV